MVSCSAIKVGVQKYEGGGIGSDGFCLPKKPLGVMSPAFLKAAQQLLDDEKLRNSLFHFALARQLSLSPLFSHFYLSNSLPSLTPGE